MLNDGTYKIKHRDQRPLEGTEIGSFEIKDGMLGNLTGLAEEVLTEGKVTAATEFEIRRLTNGYNFVEWTRPVAKNEPAKRGRTQPLISST